MYHRGSNTLRHYDSAGGCNRRPARQLASVASAIVGPAAASAAPAAPAAPAAAGGGASAPRRPKLLDVACAPQQRNSHDCGVYLLAVAQQLAAWLAAGQLAAPEALAAQELELPRLVTPAAVKELRARVLATVEQKAAGAEVRAEPGSR